MTGGRPPDELATSRSVRHFLPRAAGTGPAHGERGSRWSRRTPSSTRPVRARPPQQEPARRRITRRADTLDAGDLVLGRYRLLERLGAGGFGVVWRAHDELLHREVAVKRVWLGPDGDSERASREALAAARLSHPAIVALYEACAVDDAFYLISELVDGETLARLIAERALADEEVLEIGLALASALAHAHARGVIHRDIKPQNVLVPYRPEHGAPAPEAFARGGQAHRLRRRQPRRRGRAHAHRRRARHARLHGARAERGPRGGRRRPTCTRWRSCSTRRCAGSTPCGAPRRPPPCGASAGRCRRWRAARRDLPRALTRALDRALAPSPGDRGTLEELAPRARGDARARTQTPALATRPSARRAAAASRGCSWHRAPRESAPRARRPAVPAPRRALARRRAPPVRRARARRSPSRSRRIARATASALPRAVWLACARAP